MAVLSVPLAAPVYIAGFAKVVPPVLKTAVETTGMLDSVDAPDLIGPVVTKLTVIDRGTEK